MNVNLSKRRTPADLPAVDAEMIVADPPERELTAAERKAAGKGTPTPRRNQARAARKQQLQAKPLTRKEKRQKVQSIAAETRASLKSTDISKLPANERLPELVYTRDLVDTRANLGSAIIPVAVIYFVASFAFARTPAVAQAILFLALFWFLAMIADAVVMSRKLEAKVRARYPASTVRLRMYAARRAFGLKRMRRPIPREVPPANHWKSTG